MRNPLETRNLPEKAITENETADALNPVLKERIAPNNPEDISIETIQSAKKNLLEADVDSTQEEREELFNEALDYLGRENDLDYPIAHATGSDALRLIIEGGKIKSGGTGEHGEAVHFSAGGLQDGVSVAELDHPMSDIVELMYARFGANKQVTAELLKINADEVDGVTVLEDYIGEYFKYASPEGLEAIALRMLEAIAFKTKQKEEQLREQIASEYGADAQNLTGKMITESKLIRDFFKSSIELEANRTHYKNAEGEKRDYYAFQSIISNCESGVFPAIIYNGEVYSDPEKILDIKHGIKDPRNIQEKILKELQQQYRYLQEHDPDFDFDMLRNNPDVRKEYLLKVRDWIMRKNGPYDNLLHPTSSDSQKEKQRKIQRLEQLDNQYPCIIVIDGQFFKDSGQTYSQQKNERPVRYFSVEDRIMSDIDMNLFRQIIVPKGKMGEVRKWLGESGANIEIIPLEYLEVERLIKHQIK